MQAHLEQPDELREQLLPCPTVELISNQSHLTQDSFLGVMWALAVLVPIERALTLLHRNM